MDAKPILISVARVLREQGLEAILIGNTAAVLFSPHYPVSSLYRVIRDDDQLQLDFMTQVLASVLSTAFGAGPMNWRLEASGLL